MENHNKVTVYIHDIKWDNDDDCDDVQLPDVVEHTFDYNDDIDELEETISDWLSDEYGFCHGGFQYKIENI